MAGTSESPTLRNQSTESPSNNSLQEAASEIDKIIADYRSTHSPSPTPTKTPPPPSKEPLVLPDYIPSRKEVPALGLNTPTIFKPTILVESPDTDPEIPAKKKIKTNITNEQYDPTNPSMTKPVLKCPECR